MSQTVNIGDRQFECIDVVLTSSTETPAECQERMCEARWSFVYALVLRGQLVMHFRRPFAN
jgi:hypothetical protein